MSAHIDADIIILGGGPAGLSAALYAGRARRRVVVIDAGQPRHAVSAGVHNFLTREGMAPTELRRVAWEQMGQFPGVSRWDGRADSLAWDGDRWTAECEGARITGRAALLAVGLLDDLPDIPGLRERWGRSVHFCPYCHGWEVQDQPLATFGHGAIITHFGPLLTQWSRDVVVIDAGLSPETEQLLGQHGIRVLRSTVVGLDGPGDRLARVTLEDGTSLERSALFLAARQRQSPLVRSLNLKMDPHPMNPDGLVQVDDMYKTSAPMLWAAGDLASPMPQVIMAAASGGMAGAQMNAALVAAA